MLVFVPDKPIQRSLMFATRLEPTRVKHLLDPLSRVGSWPYTQILDYLWKPDKDQKTLAYYDFL
jgi:hypothetical protein